MENSPIALSCTEFVDVLASQAPVPGGGGAASYVAAIGSALGNMVGSLTVGKPKYADVEEDIKYYNGRSRWLQERLLKLVEKDAEVFEPLSKAYGLPKNTEEERKHKAEVMAKCLEECCKVPIEIMEVCCEAIDLCGEYAAKGTLIAVSDAGCGAIICKSALQSAALNVFINTKSMEDRVLAEQMNNRCEWMLEVYCRHADNIYDSVRGRLKK